MGGTDPATLAYTALIELWPGYKGTLEGRDSRDMIVDLAGALAEAEPRDGWTFASGWIAARRQSIAKAADVPSHDDRSLTRVRDLARSWRLAAQVTPPVPIHNVAEWLTAAADIMDAAISGEATSRPGVGQVTR